MNDMRAVIVPKSDQINADDLLAGPLTITITNVTIRPGTEQPVSISFSGDNGKPWKPCKSMARVLVHCWGADANNYIGRGLTLYCDPSVRWGGMEVGGIRISHMTDINGVQTMALTATKGSKKPFKVMPLSKSQPEAAPPAATMPANPPATLADWLKERAADLALVETQTDLDAIRTRQDVRNMLADDSRPKARDKLQAMLDAAAAKFTNDLPADDDDELPPIQNAPAMAAQ